MFYNIEGEQYAYVGNPDGKNERVWDLPYWDRFQICQICISTGIFNLSLFRDSTKYKTKWSPKRNIIRNPRRKWPGMPKPLRIRPGCTSWTSLPITLISAVTVASEINHFTQSHLNLIGFIYLIDAAKLFCSFFLSGAFQVKQRNRGLKQEKCKVNYSNKETLMNGNKLGKKLQLLYIYIFV